MAGANIETAFEINAGAGGMPVRAAERHGLPDASKAPRVLLDFAATDGDRDEIFGRVRRRCRG